MAIQDEYKVDLSVFEGPLDLLLYLIKKDEVDIYNIPIEKITTQYMEYLNLMRMLDLNIAGEFLVMAATLMMIKSRMLLPPDDRPEMEETEEQDPRWDLVRQLIEYKKFKDAANYLQEREDYQQNIFGAQHESETVHPDDGGVVLQDLSLFDLISAFSEVLKRAPADQIGQIYAEQFTVSDKIDTVLQTLKRAPQVSFFTLFGEVATRHEIVCTFLAILELIRLRQIAIRQPERFGDIFISMATPAAEAPALPPESDQSTGEPTVSADLPVDEAGAQPPTQGETESPC